MWWTCAFLVACVCEVKEKRREPVSTLSCFVTYVFALALDNFELVSVSRCGENLP